MTQQLERAFAEASKLPENEQDFLASWLLAELQSEERWNRIFSGSADTLALLAEEALEEYEAGETTELDPEQL